MVRGAVAWLQFQFEDKFRDLNSMLFYHRSHCDKIGATTPLSEFAVSLLEWVCAEFPHAYIAVYGVKKYPGDLHESIACVVHSLGSFVCKLLDSCTLNKLRVDMLLIAKNRNSGSKQMK